MLRRNLDVGEGLVNGSIGTVVDVPTLSDGIVDKLLVQFDDLEEQTEIYRDQRKVMIYPDAYLFRKQFPLSLAYGLTIHKAQGLSLATVMADLGTTVFQSGQTYVALSRCKSLEGLHLMNFSPEKIKVNEKALQEYLRLGSKPLHGDRGKRPKKRKLLMKTIERVWYTTDVSRKAKSTLTDALSQDIKDCESKKRTKPDRKRPGKKSVPKKADNAPQSRPDQIQSPHVTSNTSADHMTAIYEEALGNDIMMPTVISPGNIEQVFSDVLVPWAAGNLMGTNLAETAGEFFPDAMGTVRNAEEKWLSGTSILRAISVMQDESRIANGSTIFNMGPYARFYFNESRRSRRGRASDNSFLSPYVTATYGQRRFTRIP